MAMESMLTISSIQADLDLDMQSGPRVLANDTIKADNAASSSQPFAHAPLVPAAAVSKFLSDGIL